MVGARSYDFMYRFWAPWDQVGVRDDLRSLLKTGRVTPASHPRSIDLGCGSGANVVYLAEEGFDSYGVDFSAVAIAKARERAAREGVDCTLVQGDLTAPLVVGAEGPFDILVDFGTLDDLRGDGRRRMASTIDRLSRPGSVFLEWCFYGPVGELPRFSFLGSSRIGAPSIEPGELEELFGERWEIELFVRHPEIRAACFLLTCR